MSVVHCKKDKYDCYIARPSKWGNPFVIPRDGTREEVIAKYRAWIVTQPHLLADLHELKGKVLGCWCSPLPCHGDVLDELANTPMRLHKYCYNCINWETPPDVACEKCAYYGLLE